MTSIASMGKGTDRPDHNGPEAATLKRAVAAAKKAGKTQRQIADAVDVSEGMIWQMANGRRPVPAALAKPLADYLGIAEPATISADFANLQGSVVSMPGAPTLRPELQINRLENDIDSLRLALGAMAAVMVEHRPIEAREAAAAIRRMAPPKFHEKGFLPLLLKALDAAAPAERKATEPASARRRAARKSP